MAIFGARVVSSRIGGRAVSRRARWGRTIGEETSSRGMTGRCSRLNVPVGLSRLIDRGLVYRPTRATYDFALPLFGPYLRRRPKLTKLSSRR